MHNKIKMILFVSFIWLFGNCTSSIKNKTRDNVKWKETIGVLEPRGSTTWIHYLVDSQAYNSRYYIRRYGEIDGEKYTMRYNQADPSEIEIDYWNPIFQQNEKTIFLKAKINKVEHKGIISSVGFVRFTVLFNGGSFNREQTLPPDAKTKFPELTKGKIYLVECDPNNLRRCVILLNKPINDNINTQ